MQFWTTVWRNQSLAVVFRQRHHKLHYTNVTKPESSDLACAICENLYLTLSHCKLILLKLPRKSWLSWGPSFVFECERIEFSSLRENAETQTHRRAGNPTYRHMKMIAILDLPLYEGEGGEGKKREWYDGGSGYVRWLQQSDEDLRQACVSVEGEEVRRWGAGKEEHFVREECRLNGRREMKVDEKKERRVRGERK